MTEGIKNIAGDHADNEKAGAVKPMVGSFAPGILFEGRRYEPTGIEWLLYFSMAGCQWAIDAIPDAVKRYELHAGLGSAEGGK